VERVARKCPVRHAGFAGVPCAGGRRLGSRNFGDPRRRVGALQISVEQGSASTQDNSPTLAAVVQALTIAPEGEDEEGLAKSMIGDRAA